MNTVYSLKVGVHEYKLTILILNGIIRLKTDLLKKIGRYNLNSKHFSLKTPRKYFFFNCNKFYMTNSTLFKK